MPPFSAFLSAAMVRALLAILLLAGGLPAAAQGPAWQSARAVAVATAAATGNYSAVSATAVDAAGNVYLTGSFANTVILGSTTLTSLGFTDVFVAKFNPASNQFVWAQRAGGTEPDYAYALAVSGTSVYVAGSFDSPTAGFGPATLSNADFSDAFVAKLTDAGNTGGFVWAQRAGGNGNDSAQALAVSGTSVYVAGSFASSTAGFGAITLPNTLGGTADAFVGKLTDAGSSDSFVWAQRAGGRGVDYAYALAATGTDVYVAGGFNSATAGFGSVTLTNTPGASSDVFVAKLVDAGSTGSFAWAQRAGGGEDDRSLGVAVQGSSVYVTGTFRSATAGFGSATLANAGPASTPDVFVAKLTDAGSSGIFVWAQRAGGTDADYAYALAVSGSSVYVTGSFFSSTAGFGTTTLSSAGVSDVFVAKLADAGNTGSFEWAQRAGGTSRDEGFGLVIRGTNVYVAGSFDSAPATFSSTALTNLNLGASTGFVAALSDPSIMAGTTTRYHAPADLFPNPAHRMATLRLPAGTPPGPLTLADAQGRVVRRYPAPAGTEVVLDLQGLPAGLYLLYHPGLAQRLLVE